MARKGKTGVLKRQREAKKAEKAAMKREMQRERREGEDVDDDGDGSRVATADDMAGYGFPVAGEDDEDT